MALPPGGSSSTVVRIVIQADDRASATFKRVADQVGGQFQSRVKDLNVQFRGLDRIWTLIAVGSGAALIKTFVGFAAQLQKTQLQIAVFTKDMSAVPAVMERIFTVARKAPLDLNNLTDVFVRLKASGIDPIIDDEGNGPLKNLIDAVTAFGGGSEIFKRAGIAIQQMAGKGVISMEELRQQLGEAVPTAMRVMAAQMEISVSELIRQVTRGELEFEKGFKALDEGFRRFFGGSAELQLTTVLGALQQTRRAFQELANVLNESGAMDLFTAAITVMNKKLDEFTAKLKSSEGVQNFKDNLESIINSFFAFAEPIANLAAMIFSIGKAVIGVLSTLPEELISGGLIGLVLFGRFIGAGRGIAAGFLFGEFSSTILAISQVFSEFLNTITGALSSIGMETGDIVIGGLIGYIIFGKKGSLLGLITGAMNELMDSIGNSFARLIDHINSAFIGMIASVKAALKDPSLILDPEEIFAIGEKARKKQQELFAASFEARQKFIKSAGFDSGEEGSVGEGFKDASENAETLKGKIVELARGFDDFRQATLDLREDLIDFGGLTKVQEAEVARFGTTLERLEARAGGAGSAMRKFALETETKIAKVVKITQDLLVTMARMDKDADPKVVGVRREFEDLNVNIERARFLLAQIVGEDSQKNFERIAAQVKRLSENLDPFLVKGKEGMTALELAVEKVEARFAGYGNTVETLKRKIEKSIVVDEIKAKALKLIEEITVKLTKAQEAAILNSEKENRLKEQAQLVKAQEAQTAGELRVNILEMEVAFDKVGLAAARADARIAALIKTAREQIIKLKAARDAGFNIEDNERMIEDWKRLITVIEEAGIRFKEIMEFNASEFGKFMNTLAASMENALANAIESLATRTGSAKEIILAFYRDITAALSRYLAAQALIAVFGASSGSGLGFTLGGLFTGLFGGGGGAPGGGPGGSQEPVAAQTGGTFIVGGAGSADSKLALMKLSPGERVDVTPPGEPLVGGGGGGGGTIIIQALDGASVMRVLSENQREIVGLFQGRQRLNRLGAR
jgi:tape measure domain-containing protein